MDKPRVYDAVKQMGFSLLKKSSISHAVAAIVRSEVLSTRLLNDLKIDYDNDPEWVADQTLRAAFYPGIATTHGDGDMAKEKKEKGAAGAKGVGIIDAIESRLRLKNGASVVEIVDYLKEKFPDRDPEGMKKTVRAQLSRLPTTRDLKIEKEKHDKRGFVYSVAA